MNIKIKFCSIFISLSLLLASTITQAWATDKGLFWKLEAPNGNVSYLFGTIHTDDNRVTDFSQPVLDAIGQADVFLMETEPSNNPSVYLMQNANLQNMLTDSELTQVRALADFHTMHLDAAMQMKPWLLAVVFDLPKPQTPYAQDNLLMSAAESDGKTVVGIETSQEHFSIIDSFDYDTQLIMLRAVLKRSQAQKEKDFERLLALYLKGDSDQIAAFDDKTTSAMLPAELWARMRTKLVDERNALMARRAIQMANQTTLFIAVGASHLAGNQGLIAAFRQAGFKLSPIRQSLFN